MYFVDENIFFIETPKNYEYRWDMTVERLYKKHDELIKVLYTSEEIEKVREELKQDLSSN